MNSYG